MDVVSAGRMEPGKGTLTPMAAGFLRWNTHNKTPSLNTDNPPQVEPFPRVMPDWCVELPLRNSYRYEMRTWSFHAEPVTQHETKQEEQHHAGYRLNCTDGRRRVREAARHFLRRR